MPRPSDSGFACNCCTAFSHMLHLKPTALRILCAILLSLAGRASSAQYLVAGNTQRGSGILQSCDPSMQVDFVVDRLDNYACHFTPQITSGSTEVSSTVWHYFSGVEWVSAYGSPTIPYLGTEPYPMCLAVDAFDQIASQPCSTVVCKVVAPVPHALCAQLEANFSIGAIQGNLITFVDESQFEGGQIASAFWSFGDGSSIASTPSPAHEFFGSGPFQVCLTVVGAPPTNCTATICQWLYMGPGGMNCSDLVSQGFAILQHNEWVGALDTSLTSGMNHRVDWDFGDGAHATGIIAAHAYSPFQPYDLCGTLKAWGPLLPDTCVSTICRQVFPSVAIQVNEAMYSTDAWVWPSPFDDRLSVRAMPTGGVLVLFDGLGKEVLRASLEPGSSTQSVQASFLPPGLYTAVLSDGRHRQYLRVVRNP